MKTDAASRGSPEQGGNWAMAGMRLGARPAECCMNVNAIVAWPDRAARTLEHDPEKHALGPRPDGWVPVFPRDKREAFARRSRSNKKIERDDDSKESHPALASQIQISPAGQLAQYPRCIYKRRIVARTGEDLNMISIRSQIALARPMPMLDACLAL